MTRRRIAAVGILAGLLGIAVWLGARALRGDSGAASSRSAPGMLLLVRVQDEAGAPIAGARVYREGGVALDQRTGADGTTLLRGFDARSEPVQIEADGFAPESIGGLMPDRSEIPIERVVTLRRGARVRGVVLDPDGAPIEGAWIAGYPEPHVVSAADGSWERIVPAGTWTFVAGADGYAAGWSGPHELDGRTPKDEVVIQLRRGLAIRGIVVDADGAPVGGAKVVHTGRSTSGQVRADDDGRFVITGLDEGRHSIAAFDGERGSQEVRVEVADEVPELRLVVVDSMIRGVVVDEAGEPVAGVEVWALGGGGTGGEDRATTDAFGVFALGPLVPGRYSLARIYPGGAPRVISPPVEATTGDRDVRFVLPSAGGVRGRVTRNGHAVPSFVVAAHDPALLDDAETAVIANAGGVFEIGPLAPGNYLLVIAGEGFARHTLPLRVEPGRIVDLGAIEVPEGRTLRGRVVTPDGDAVAGARVEVGRHRIRGSPDVHEPPFRRALDGARAATTGADGTFVIEHLSVKRDRRRRLELVAEHPTHGRSAASPVPNGDDVVELVVAPVGEIRGSISGRPPDEPGSVAVQRDGTKIPTAMVVPDGAGRFHVEGLVPGTYRVFALIAGDGVQSTRVTATTDVRSGETSVVDLGFGTVTLRIEAVPGCRLRLVRGAVFSVGELESRLLCDEQGRASAEGLAAGRYLLCAGLMCAPVTITESPETQTFRWE